MNIKGVLLALIVGIGVLFISKWMVLANILIVPYIISYFRTAKFKCNQCGHIQTDCVILSEHTNEMLSHGRYTKSGGLDRRYNSTFDTSVTYDYGVECAKCRNIYHISRTF
jgi:hypothetical protein